MKPLRKVALIWSALSWAHVGLAVVLWPVLSRDAGLLPSLIGAAIGVAVMLGIMTRGRSARIAALVDSRRAVSGAVARERPWRLLPLIAVAVLLQGLLAVGFDRWLGTGVTGLLAPLSFGIIALLNLRQVRQWERANGQLLLIEPTLRRSRGSRGPATYYSVDADPQAVRDSATSGRRAP